MGRKPLSEDEASRVFGIKLPGSWVVKIHRLKLQKKIREAIRKVIEDESQ